MREMPASCSGGNVGRRDRVHHFGGRVAEHALGADVEDLDDAFLVGGDAREILAVENRGLQGPRFTQRLFAPDLVTAIRGADDVVVGKRGVVGLRGHVLILRPQVPP